ncbi:MAG: hypothetical protein WKG07_20645 [Hymenobacter sp.]
MVLSAAGATWWRAARLAGAGAGAVGVALLAVLSSRWASTRPGCRSPTACISAGVFGLGYYAARRGPGRAGPWQRCWGRWPRSFVFLLPGWEVVWAAGAGVARAGGGAGHRAAGRPGAVRPGGPGYGRAAFATITNAFRTSKTWRIRCGGWHRPRAWASCWCVGLFALPVLLALGRPGGRRVLAPCWVCAASLALLAVVVVHMLLLSGDLGAWAVFAPDLGTVALALVAEPWGHG